jgi:hypothetical protein
MVDVDLVMSYLRIKAPCLVNECKLPELFDDGKSELYRGHVQSGKSNVMFCLALFSLVAKQKNCVVVLCDLTKDFKQFERGFNLFMSEFCEFLESKGITSFKPIDVIGSFRIPKTLPKKMSEKTCLNVCMANKSQLSKLLPFLQSRDFTLIVDEADMIAYSSGKYGEVLQTIQQIAYKTYEVTATSFKCLFSDTSPSADHIHVLPPPSNYKGVRSVNYLSIPEIELFYSCRLHEPIFEKGTYGLTESHPIIILHKTSMLHVDHMETFEYVRTKGFTAILFNSDGVWLADKSLPTVPFEIYGRISTIRNGVHVFSKLVVQHALQFLKNNGGAERFPRIIIVSGMLASRGTNFTSTDFGWHLTHEYYLPAKQADTAKLTQSMRIYGVYADTVPLKCYTTQAVIADIYKSALLEEDTLQRLQESHVDKDAKTMLSNEFTFYAKKIPKRRLIDTAYPSLRTTSSKEDGGCVYEAVPPCETEVEIEHEEEEEGVRYISKEGLSKTHMRHYETFTKMYTEGKYDGWQERTLIDTISQQSAWHFFQKAVPVASISKRGLYVRQDADKTWWFKVI